MTKDEFEKALRAHQVSKDELKSFRGKQLQRIVILWQCAWGDFDIILIRGIGTRQRRNIIINQVATNSMVRSGEGVVHPPRDGRVRQVHGGGVRNGKVLSDLDATKREAG